MQIRACPKCGSHSVHRSRRRTFYERWILRLTLRRPYRCHHCNWRFVGSMFSKSAWPAGREPVEPEAEEESAGGVSGER